MPFVLQQTRDLLSIISDFSGILGVIISILTLFVATRIRKKMLEQQEKGKFRNEAEKIIEDLQTIEESMSTDHLFTKKIIEKLDRQSEKLINEFPQALKGSKNHLKKVVKETEFLLKEMEMRNDEKASDGYYNEMTRKLLKYLRKTIAELQKDRALT